MPALMSAQSAIDAYNLSQNELRGTARYMSMAGAFTALGGDLSTLNNNPAGIDTAFRGYEIWPGGESSFQEYDDDGATQAYLDGESTRTSVECRQQAGKVTVTIGKTTGSFEGFQPLKRTHLSIRASKAPKKVEVRKNANG